LSPSFPWSFWWGWGWGLPNILSACAMRGNHHKQETALFVLLLIHYGVYPDVPVKLADLGHKRIMEGKIQEA